MIINFYAAISIIISILIPNILIQTLCPLLLLLLLVLSLLLLIFFTFLDFY